MRVLVCLAIFLVSMLPVAAQRRSRDTLTLYFAFNQSQLRQEESTKLDAFFHRINPATDTLFVSGYTDTVGTTPYNKALSMRRAQQVAARAGAQPGIVVTAAGESDQVQGGDSVNRRVVVIRTYPAAVARDTTATTTPATTTTTPSDTTTAGKPDSVVTLKDINFLEDQALLTESSRMFLPHYITILRQYKSDYIEVDGFCNSTQPVTDPNDPLFKLSVKRARLIYDVLVDEGFDPSHLSYKGMGNRRSKFAHPVTAEEMHANMRVEVLIFHKAPAANN